MKKQNNIIIIFCVVLTLLTACFLSVYADNTDTSSSSSSSSSTTESTTESTTTSTTSHTKFSNRFATTTNTTTTTKPSDTNTATVASTTENTTIRGTTKKNKTTTATGVQVDYPKTTYKNNQNTVVITQSPTYTTASMVVTDADSYTTLGEIATDTTNNIEVYTWYASTVSETLNSESIPAVEEDEDGFHFDYRIFIGILIILMIIIVVTVVLLFKQRKDYRGSLFFRFGKK